MSFPSRTWQPFQEALEEWCTHILASSMLFLDATTMVKISLIIFNWHTHTMFSVDETAHGKHGDINSDIFFFFFYN